MVQSSILDGKSKLQNVESKIEKSQNCKKRFGFGKAQSMKKKIKIITGLFYFLLLFYLTGTLLPSMALNYAWPHNRQLWKVLYITPDTSFWYEKICSMTQNRLDL